VGSVCYCDHGRHHFDTSSDVCVGVVYKVKIVVSCHNCSRDIWQCVMT